MFRICIVGPKDSTKDIYHLGKGPDQRRPTQSRDESSYWTYNRKNIVRKEEVTPSLFGSYPYTEERISVRVYSEKTSELNSLFIILRTNTSV